MAETFVSLPTGFGKSLCFQSVPFVWDFLFRQTLGEDAQSILLVVGANYSYHGRSVCQPCWKRHFGSLHQPWTTESRSEGGFSSWEVQVCVYFAWIYSGSTKILRYASDTPIPRASGGDCSLWSSLCHSSKLLHNSNTRMRRDSLFNMTHATACHINACVTTRFTNKNQHAQRKCV